MIAPNDLRQASPTSRRSDAANDGTSPMPTQSPPADLSSMVADLAKLTELQRRLAVLEIETAVRAVGPVVGQFVVGGAVTLGALPVLITALAEWCQRVTNLSVAASGAIVGGTVALLGVALMLIAIRSLRRLPPLFVRSSRQWLENVQWIARTLRGSPS